MERTMDIIEADEIINKKLQFLISDVSDVNDTPSSESQTEEIVKTENSEIDNAVDDGDGDGNDWSEINDYEFLNLGYGLEVEVQAAGGVAIYENVPEIDHQNNAVAINVCPSPEEVWTSEDSSNVNNEQDIKYVVLSEVRVLLDRQAVSNYIKSKETLSREQIQIYQNETGYVVDQNETEQYVTDQNETQQYITDQNGTIHYITDQNETIKYVINQNQTEEFITDQNETEEFITNQNQAEEYITDQNETEEYITDQNETEEYVTHQNETEEYVLGQNETEYEIEQYETEQYAREQYEREVKAKYTETLHETEESDLNTTCTETWYAEDNNVNAKYTVITTKEVAEINASTNLIKIYCKNCDKAFQNGHQNLANCPSCQNPLVFQCAKCHESSRFFKSMQNHVSIICGQQFNYQCNQCKLISKNKNRILNHIKKVHTAVERSGDFECYKCQKKIKYHRNLTRHQKICGVKKGFKCKVCLTRIKNYDDYRNHLLTHFSAPDQEFVDINQSNLPLIKTIKTEISCSNGKYSAVHLPVSNPHNSFSNGHEEELNESAKKKQKKSETTYSKTKHFFCDDCDQRCTTKASLELHIVKIHVKLNIKPDADGNFLCPKCNKLHQGARKFSNHHRSCSLPKVFKCKFCSYRLSKKDYLRTHMKNKHPEIDTEEREKVLNEIEKAVKRKMQANNKDVKAPKKEKADKVYKKPTKVQKIVEVPQNIQIIEQPRKIRKIYIEASKVQTVCAQPMAVTKVYKPPAKFEPKQAVKVEHVYQQEPLKVCVQSVKIEQVYQPSTKVEAIYQSPLSMNNLYDSIFLQKNLSKPRDMSKEQIMNVIGADYQNGYIYDGNKEKSIRYDAY